MEKIKIAKLKIPDNFLDLINNQIELNKRFIGYFKKLTDNTNNRIDIACARCKGQINALNYILEILSNEEKIQELELENSKDDQNV